MAASVPPFSGAGVNGSMLNYGTPLLTCTSRVASSIPARRASRARLSVAALPHILLLPFVQNYRWGTGLAAVIPSSLSYIASCAGIYRWRGTGSARAAGLALVFFALNRISLPRHRHDERFSLRGHLDRGLVVEWRAAIDRKRSASFELRSARRHRLEHRALRRLQACIAAALVAAISPATTAGSSPSSPGAALQSRCSARAKRERDALLAAFWLRLSLSPPAALWFLYNSVCLATGSTCARALSAHRSNFAPPPGSLPHPGWHSPWSRSSIPQSLRATLCRSRLENFWAASSSPVPRSALPAPGS